MYLINLIGFTIGFDSSCIFTFPRDARWIQVLMYKVRWRIQNRAYLDVGFLKPCHRLFVSFVYEFVVCSLSVDNSSLPDLRNNLINHWYSVIKLDFCQQIVKMPDNFVAYNRSLLIDKDLILSEIFSTQSLSLAHFHHLNLTEGYLNVNYTVVTAQIVI
jgi:hypothetical protein